MANVVPSLSDRGWVKGPSEKADQLLANFFATDVAQSYLYKDHMTNAQGLLAQYGKDIPRLCSEMQAQLQTYLAAYFDRVNVEVTSDAFDPAHVQNTVTLTISIGLAQDGVNYAIDKMVQAVNSKFKRITNYINTGVLGPAV